VEAPAACSKCGSKNIEQDQDVLDTWFSSGLWPHSTLGWPEDTEDLRYFYPTSVMETAYDLIFFWVARMIMMGIEDTGDIPFRTIYFHGLLRDEKGDKMSKTRGNVVDPLDLIEQYGTDALRFALTTSTSPGNDSRLSTEKMESGRNFANKLWNASRFVIRSLDAVGTGEIKRGELPVEDRWILSRLSRTVSGVTGLMEAYEFGEAQRQLHDFLWGEFCDWYIELAKIRLAAGASPSPVPVLVHVLEMSLRLLHPYMPFVTEELWQTLKKHTGMAGTESIMLAAYPEADKADVDPAAEDEVGTVIEVVRAIRNIRAQYKVPNNRWVEARIHTDTARRRAIAAHTEAVRVLARVNPIAFPEGGPEGLTKDKTLVLPLERATVVIPMASMVDLGAEKKKLQKELEQAQAEVARLEARLGDQAFLTRAPAAVVEKERQKLILLRDRLARLREQNLKYEEVGDA
jgi:valyl-tRNA synthetase